MVQLAPRVVPPQSSTCVVKAGGSDRSSAPSTSGHAESKSCEQNSRHQRPPLAERVGRRSSFGSDLNSCSKYAMVFISPSRSCTRGAHESSSSAKLMSGQRCLGSSSGSGRKTIFADDPVSAITVSASCRNREFDWVSKIHRAGHMIGRLHQSYQSVDEIVDVAE